jgi:hypothetical protein
MLEEKHGFIIADLTIHPISESKCSGDFVDIVTVTVCVYSRVPANLAS